MQSLPGFASFYLTIYLNKIESYGKTLLKYLGLPQLQGTVKL